MASSGPSSRLARPLVAASLPLVLLVHAGCPRPAPPADATPLDAATDATPDAPVGPPGITARFNLPTDGTPPAPFEVPFPSDLYRAPDGTLLDTLDQYGAIRITRNTALFAQGLRDLDGFGQSTGAMFLIDGAGALASDPPPEIDPASLPADAAACTAPGASAFIVDLDPSATAANARVPCAAGWVSHFRTITVQPDHAVLAPGRRYAVVLTTAVRALGSPAYALRASPAFGAIRDDGPGARATAAGRLYGDAVERIVALAGPGFDRASIAAVAVFTTQTTSRQLRAARDALVADRFGPAPPLVTDPATAAPFTVVRFGASAHPGWTATLDAWLGTARRDAMGRDVPGWPASDEPAATAGIAHDALGAVLSAVYTAPDFRGPDGHLALGADGVPRVANPDQRLPVTLALPRGPAPANGFPVVIYAHGLGGQRVDVLGLANEMARAGIATAAIDWTSFGQRAVPMPPDARSNAPGAETYRGPDGFADTTNGSPGDFVGNFQDMVVFRDNLRQSALEIVQLRRVLASPALDLSALAAEYGGTAPRLDGRHVAYIGGSLGGIIGTVVAAAEPEIDPVVLNVAGAGFLTRVVTGAPNQGPLVQGFLSAVFNIPSTVTLDRFHPVMNLLQTVLDGGDPAVYAREVTHPAGGGRGHDVLLIEALWDETLANDSTELLASLLELPQLAPVGSRVDALPLATAPVAGNLAGGATGGYFQLAPAAHYSDLIGRQSNQLRFAPPFPRASGVRFPPVAHPYTVREWVVPLQRNVATFLSSAFAGAARVEVAGMEPLLDLDDDGWTDDEERAASTDPFDPGAHPAGTPPHRRDVGY